MAVCLAIAIHTMFVRHFRYTSICAKCRPMEPRGGIEPPHVRDVTGRRFRFCYCTRHIKHHRMDDALSGIHRTSLEPPGGIEPPTYRLQDGCSTC